MINESPSIPAIYRDFTLARPKAVFEPQFDELLYLLRMIVRPVHIILTGVGMRRVSRVTRMLASSGYSYTIVSPEPILMAISSGKRLHVNDDGSVLGIQDLGINRMDLALLNLEVFSQLCSMHSKL